MSTPSIRAMRADDIPRAIELWLAIEGVGLNESDEPARLRDFLERNPELSLVATDGDQMVAAVLCGHDGRRGYLHHLAVAPTHRGRGLGTQLVDRCLALLREQRIVKCNIFLYADNEVGARFWRRKGWSHRQDLQVLQHAT
jgi:N-acetylglutamate synthase